MHFLMTDEDMVLQAEGITFVKTQRRKKLLFGKFLYTILEDLQT